MVAAVGKGAAAAAYIAATATAVMN